MNEELPANFVYSIAISPTFSQDGICFAAQQSGLFRSVDRGLNWRNAYQALAQETPFATHAVAFSPNFSHDQTVFAAVQGGILRSTDNGDHWQIAQLPSPPPVASGLCVSPNYMVDGQAFCATVEDGVFITRDRGSTWASWNFGLLDLQTLCLAVSPLFAQDDTLMVGSESGIYRSKNGGRAWKAVNFPVDSAPVTSLVFSTTYEVDHTLFAGTINGELFQSNDRGNSWVVFSQFEAGIDQILVGVNFRLKPEILLLSGSVIHYSSNAGQTWKKRRIALLEKQDLTSIAAPDRISAKSQIFVGTINQGIFVSSL